jgi:hypothetical protein
LQELQSIGFPVGVRAAAADSINCSWDGIELSKELRKLLSIWRYPYTNVTLADKWTGAILGN